MIESYLDFYFCSIRSPHFLLEIWGTGKDDHDLQVNSFKEFLSIEATFILETSTFLVKNVVRNEDVFILLLRGV